LPKVSPKMLRLALAWEIQSRAYGGHSRAVTRQLGQLERGLTKTAAAKPGMRLALLSPHATEAGLAGRLRAEWDANSLKSPQTFPVSWQAQDAMLIASAAARQRQ
jgi:hypothetical protein